MPHALFPMLHALYAAGFLTGVLQNHARKYDYPIDHLSFKYEVLKGQYRSQVDISEAQKRLQYGEVLDEDKTLKNIADGVLVHGLFMDGFRWSDSQASLEDSHAGEMSSVLPVVRTVCGGLPVASTRLRGRSFSMLF